MDSQDTGWITLVPIALSGRISPGAYRRIREGMTELGWGIRPLSAIERATLPTGTESFSEGSSLLYVPPVGHAVVVCQSIPRSEGLVVSESHRHIAQQDVVEYLRERRSRHLQLVEPPHCYAGIDYTQVVTCIRRAASDEVPRYRRRPDVGTPITYAMTVQLVETQARSKAELTREERAGIAYMLRPSAVSMDDSPFLVSPSATSPVSIDADEILDLHPDLDFGSETMVFASWAAVVVVGHIDQQIVDLMRALEVRLQSSWATADWITDLSAEALDHLESKSMTTRQLEWLAVELQHVGNLAQEEPDAMASERVASIAEGLSQTSGHREKWASAERAINHLQQVVGLVRSDRNRRTSIALEAMLVVFALAQLAPIVLDLPINSAKELAAQVPAVGALALTLTLLVYLVVRRAR